MPLREIFCGLLYLVPFSIIIIFYLLYLQEVSKMEAEKEAKEAKVKAEIELPDKAVTESKAKAKKAAEYIYAQIEKEIALPVNKNNQELVKKIDKNLFPRSEDIPQQQKINLSDVRSNTSIITKTHTQDVDPKIKKDLILGLEQTFQNNTNMKFTVTGSNSALSSLAQLPMLSSFFSGCYQLQFRIPDSSYKQYTFDQISQDENTMNHFQMDMKQNLATAFNVLSSDVIIFNVSKGSITVDFVILGFSTLTERNHLHKIDLARQSLQQNMSIQAIDLTQTQKTYVLNSNDFDVRGNFVFGQANNHIRGGQVYYQPAYPWEGFGLNVRSRFIDDGWLEMDANPNEWAVAFHGVKDPTGYALPKITLEGLKKGLGQAYQSQLCKRTRQIIGIGIYCSPKIEICLNGYTSATDLNGQNYKYVFQCRVKPSAIRDCGNDYWVINDPKDIRPYRLLVLKC